MANKIKFEFRRNVFAVCNDVGVLELPSLFVGLKGSREHPCSAMAGIFFIFSSSKHMYCV